MDDPQGIGVFLWSVFQYLMVKKFTNMFIKISNVGTIYREMGITEVSKGLYNIQNLIPLE